MSMNIPTGEESLPDSPLDDHETLLRLRRAEATIESQLDALRHQETLVNDLTTATEGWAQAQQEVARADLELIAARRAAGWRGLARAGKRRLRRLLPGPAPQPAPAPHVGDGEGMLSSAGDKAFVWEDARYGRWIELYDSLDDARRKGILDRLAQVGQQPLISIVFPVYNPPEDFLRQAIDSVRGQLYTNWELCIADDCSTLPYVAKVLDEYAALDDRILVLHRESNGHISACSNSAVALARGPWLCLMDHDDLLAEHALALAVLALDQNPTAAILYSDEDHIDAQGNRREPYFKPDFDPLLILGQNYFSHLCMLRTDLVARVGGFRVGYEGSQDWDLVLRVLEQVRPEQVVHLPHVLYHWRAHAESTASSVAAKPYVVDASRLVVEEHLERIGVEAQIATMWGTSFNRVNWALPKDPPKVSVIVLPRHGERLRRCIESIRILTPYPALEVIVVDDGAFRPPMRQMLDERTGWLTVIENAQDLSDSAQRNFAARAATGDVLCFVADDIEVLSDSWLQEIVGTLAHPGIGCVGVKLLYPDLMVQHAGYVIGIEDTVGSPHRLGSHRLGYGYSGRLRLAHCPSAVSWACLAVRREAFDEVGGFSEDHFTGIFGDVDLCLRLREAGWRTGWAPHAELIRHVSRDEGQPLEGANAVRFDRDIRYLHQRWGAWVENDPAYSPNLSLAHESISLAWPPRTSLD
jgi:glycosyltransferase involved in cell wall biosynthesis